MTRARPLTQAAPRPDESGAISFHKLSGKRELLSKHFFWSEFACRDGTPYPAEWATERLYPLVEALERIRWQTKNPIQIVSGYRTLEYNRKIGGAKHSQHLEGRAVDIVGLGETPVTMKALLEDLIRQGEIPPGGIGLYPTFLHYDQRGYNVRWRGHRRKN